MAKPDNILLAGYYGMKNVGDDCFGVVSTWGARKYWEAENVSLLSSEHLVSSVKTVSCLSKEKKYKGQARLQSYLNILKSNLVVWSGGSIFHSKENFGSPRTISLLASRAKITPSGAIGVSLGPYKSVKDEKYVHSSLSSLRFLALRDNSSYEEALSLNLPYRPIEAADLAMLLPMVSKHRNPKKRKEKILGVTVCHYERYAGKDVTKEKKRETVLLESLKRLICQGFEVKIRFFVFNGHPHYGDNQITHAFVEKLKTYGAEAEVVQYYPDPLRVWEKVAECSAFVSVRLHGSIYAAAAGVPCISVEYHKKCGDFRRDIGVPGRFSVGDLDCEPLDLTSRLIDLFDVELPAFYPKRDKLIGMAENNFKVALSSL